MFRISNPASALYQRQVSDSDGSNNATSNCRQQELARRASRKLARHHPNVKLLPRLEEKSKEEQIQRSCDRCKSYPTAVDTLIRALQTILSNPSEQKYRRIDQTNAGYQQSLATAPGAEPLLRAVGFYPASGGRARTTLFLKTVDKETLQLAIDGLEATKETPEYKQSKRHLVFAKEVATLLNSTTTKQEESQRKNMLSNLPRAPGTGRGTLIVIQLGDKDNNKISRRFDGDDTLQDVLNWLGGTVGAIFPEKLVQTREWALVDVNRLGQTPILCDDAEVARMTLQHLGLWPSGRLQLSPSSLEWISRSSSTLIGSAEMTASRGLASAHDEML